MGEAKMRRRFLRGPRGHLLYGVDGNHFGMYLQILVREGHVHLRKQGDGFVELPFPVHFAPLQRGHRSASRLRVALIRIIFVTDTRPWGRRVDLGYGLGNNSISRISGINPLAWEKGEEKGEKDGGHLSRSSRDHGLESRRNLSRPAGYPAQ
jgi:hypothetical protein